jgi:uncharacterized protein YutE (UPF0331/DUF86 family)
VFVTDSLKSKVGETLAYMDTVSRWLSDTAALPAGWAASDNTRRFAAERAIMVSVESVTDAASDIIDALVMRDAGSYADLVRVLVEEGVVAEKWFQAFLQVIEARQALLRRYRDIESQFIEETVRQIAPLLPHYSTRLREYLGM